MTRKKILIVWDEKLSSRNVKNSKYEIVALALERKNEKESASHEAVTEEVLEQCIRCLQDDGIVVFHGDGLPEDVRAMGNSMTFSGHGSIAEMIRTALSPSYAVGALVSAVLGHIEARTDWEAFHRSFQRQVPSLLAGDLNAFADLERTKSSFLGSRKR